MLNKACLALVGVLAFLPQMAVAADNPAGRCVDVSVPKNAITARNGRWIELTNEQWEFMRGIYAMNPETPAGLPYGDKACTPMPIPVELIAMMRDVATDTISHETGGL